MSVSNEDDLFPTPPMPQYTTGTLRLFTQSDITAAEQRGREQ